MARNMSMSETGLRIRVMPGLLIYDVRQRRLIRFAQKMSPVDVAAAVELFRLKKKSPGLPKKKADRRKA